MAGAEEVGAEDDRSSMPGSVQSVNAVRGARKELASEIVGGEP